MLHEILIDLHHVQCASAHHDESPFLDKFRIGVLHTARHRHLCPLADVRPALDTEASVFQREQERKGTEVVTLTQVDAK